MPDFSGPIQSFDVASWLWLILFLPFAGALLNLLYCSGQLGSLIFAVRFAFVDDDEASTGAAPREREYVARVASRAVSARIAVVSLGLSFATAAWYVKVLAERAPEGRLLLCHVWQLVRAGQLEAGVDLAFDPLAATLVIVVTGLATLAALHAAASDEATSDDEAWRFFGVLGALVGALLVVLLADNLLLLLVGWAAVGHLGLRLVRGLPGMAEVGAGRAFIFQRVGDACLALATCVLFWGAGGEWSSAGDYQSDLEPRVAAVSLTAGDAPLAADDPALRGGAATQGKGFLTVAAVPGALVYMDDSHTPLLDKKGLPQRTPFARREVAGGAHSFRFAPDDTFRLGDAKVPFVVEGGVLPNYSISRFAVGGDREVSLSVIGPTLRFRELADQLRMVDPKGVHRLRDAFLRRKIEGSSGPDLVTLVCFLILAGAVLKSLPLPLSEWLPAASGRSDRKVATSVLVHASGMAMIAGYLVSRLSCLFAPSLLASALVAALGIGLALFGAFASILQYELRRVLAFASLSQLGLAFVAIGVRAYTASVLQLTTHAIVMSGLLVAVGLLPKEMTDIRQMGGLAASSARAAASYRIGCIALTSAPIPFLSGYWPLAGVLEATFLPPGFASLAGTVLYGLALAAVGLASFGLWRSYYVVFSGLSGEKRRASPPSPEVSRIALTLAALSALAGVVLGASSRDVGGDGESLLEQWLGPVFRGIHPTEFFFVSRLGLIGAGFAVALAGWWLARRRYGEERPRDWAEREAALPGQALGASLR